MKYLIAALVMISTAQAATLYFEDGSSVDVPEGSSVYVSPVQPFVFTVFESEVFELQALEPAASVVEECTEESGLTFGGSSTTSCEEVVETPEEECDQLTFGGSGC